MTITHRCFNCGHDYECSICLVDPSECDVSEDKEEAICQSCARHESEILEESFAVPDKTVAEMLEADDLEEMVMLTELICPKCGEVGNINPLVVSKNETSMWECAYCGVGSLWHTWKEIECDDCE